VAGRTKGAEVVGLAGLKVRGQGEIVKPHRSVGEAPLELNLLGVCSREGKESARIGHGILAIGLKKGERKRSAASAIPSGLSQDSVGFLDEGSSRRVREGITGNREGKGSLEGKRKFWRNLQIEWGWP